MRALNFKTVNPLSMLVMAIHRFVSQRRLAWNPGICLPYGEALELGLIEERIAPLAAILKVPGLVRTDADFTTLARIAAEVIDRHVTRPMNGNKMEKP